MPIDEYVEGAVVARLTEADAAKLWQPDRPDLADLLKRSNVLRRRRDDIKADYEDGVITQAEFREMRQNVLGKLGDVEAKIAAAGSSSPLSIVAADDVEAEWDRYSLARKRAVVTELVVPVIRLVGAGVRGFSPESVQLEWLK